MVGKVSVRMRRKEGLVDDGLFGIVGDKSVFPAPVTRSPAPRPHFLPWREEDESRCLQLSPALIPDSIASTPPTHQPPLPSLPSLPTLHPLTPHVHTRTAPAPTNQIVQRSDVTLLTPPSGQVCFTRILSLVNTNSECGRRLSTLLTNSAFFMPCHISFLGIGPC